MKDKDFLSAEAIGWARSHILLYGDTDIFPVPFEYQAIDSCWDDFREVLLDVNLNEFETHSSIRVLVPKPGGLYRVCKQLDPLDSIVYSSMVYEVAEKLERYRVPRGERISCSYRVELNSAGQLYRSADGWSDFTEKSKELSDGHGWVVVADIVDFYNQIYQHRIRNVLEASGVSSNRARLLERFLSGLSGTASRGIPVGPPASIILAEAVLADVDDFLLRKTYAFTRYVDDFRIFCRTERRAVQALHDLYDYLSASHQLTLNMAKSRILPIEDFEGKFLFDPKRHEEESRDSQLRLAAELVRDFTGYEIGVADLTKEEKSEVTNDVLRSIFQVCITASELNVGWARRLLRRATKRRTKVLLEAVLANLDQLVPVMRDVCGYLAIMLRKNDVRDDIVSRLLRFVLLEDIGFLPFVRYWVMHLLSTNIEGVDIDDLQMIIDGSKRRSVIPSSRFDALSAASLGAVDRVRGWKETWQNNAPWDRRSIILSSVVLSSDERRAWLRRVKGTSDPIDGAIAAALLSGWSPDFLRGRR